MNRNKRSVALFTLGCKVNQFESASFLSGFEERGATVVPFSGGAEVLVINTCAVTAKAAAQSRQAIRRALRASPDARVVVTGCYAQVAAREVLEMADRSVCIVGNSFKDQLVDIALAVDHCDLEMFTDDIGMRKEVCHLPVKRFGDRTRAYLRVQDGCNRFCSYCIVPFARGRSRSVPPEEVLAQLATFIDEGYREVVLTGIHIGLYGLDLSPSLTLAGLMARLAAATPQDGVRFRVSSLEPAEVTDDFLRLLREDPRFVPHLHIPLQSGDSEVLSRMNRRYTAEDFVAVVEKVAATLPEAAIGLDVLVGFPGEEDAAFANTVELIERLPVTYLHVFPYSKRPGTAAAGFAGQVPKAVKDERAARLRELDHQKRTAFYGRFLGKVRPVLAENAKNPFRLMRGMTDNYIPVHFDAPADVANRIVPVRVERLIEQNVFGSMAQPQTGGEGGA